MIANKEFHTVNSCNGCTVVSEEMSDHVETDKTKLCLLCYLVFNMK